MRARENPLRVERVHQLRHVPVGWTWQDLDARLRELEYRGAIVGPQGSGKTTLLNDLDAQLTRRGMGVIRIMLSDMHRWIPEPSLEACRRHPESFVFLDGAEQLPRRRWRSFQREVSGSRGLIVTSHRPTDLPTLVECRTSPQLLERLLNELLTPEIFASLGDLPGRLCRNYNGNLRSVIRSLYDHLADTV